MSIDATQYGLNPGVESDSFTEDLISNEGQSQEKRDEAKRIVARWGQMDTEAINWKLHWQRCYQYIVPRKEDVIAVRMPGDDRESDIFDTTAVALNEELGAAMHSMLTNPETRFFELLFGDPKIDNIKEVKQWCQDVSDRMYQILNQSNFQTEIFELYVDLTGAGTGHLYAEESDEFVVQFSARALKEIRIDENAWGLVDTVYRTFKLRPFQILQMFPEVKMWPNDLKAAADKNSVDQIEILHAIEPVDQVRDEVQSKKLKYKKHKISSTYILKDKCFIVSQSSYAEMPYCNPRWSKTTGEKYGRGPGFQALPDIMMVNAMMLTIIQGAQKTVDPPLQVEDDAVIGQVRLTPAGLTVVRPGSSPIKPLIQGVPQIEFGQKCLEDVRQRIRNLFHVDKLKLPQESPQRTAEEVRQIVEEQMRLMGPVLGRQHFELLRPLVNRLFGIMLRKGLIPPAPAQVQGKNLTVRYTSLIARAQRLQELQDIQRAITTLQPLAAAIPTIMDVVKADDIVREVWDILGIDQKLLMSEQELKKKRDEQQKAQQQAANNAQELHKSQVAKNTAPIIQAGADAQQAQQPQQGQPGA